MTDLISTFPALPLTWECSIVWEARDPTTFDPVSGVVISQPVLYGLNLTDTGQPITPTSQVAPIWVPIPVDTIQPSEG